MVGQVVSSTGMAGQGDPWGLNPDHALLSKTPERATFSNLHKGRVQSSGHPGNKRPKEAMSEHDCLQLIYGGQKLD